MKRRICLKTLLFATIGVSPVALQSQQANTPAARLEPFGLEGKRVTALGISPQFSGSLEYLYAATDSAGVYRRYLLHPDSGWQSLGLPGKKLTALDIQVWGAGPAIFHAPIVGVEPDRSQGDSALIYRLEDKGWIPADSGLARNEIHRIKALASFESLGHAPPGRAFAGGSSRIYGSFTFSRWWVELFSIGSGNTNVIAIQRRGIGYLGQVWAGGETGFFGPWIAKTADVGQTWELFYPNLSGDNACLSLAIHPQNPDIVYAGMQGAVIKTTDGGKSWDLNVLCDSNASFSSVIIDPFNLEHVYAGSKFYLDGMAFWESFDAGKTWRLVYPPPFTVPIRVIKGITSMAADRQVPGVIYLATDGDGVLKYQGAVTAVRDKHKTTVPEHFVLKQNYPNPFNAGTVIRFVIPAALVHGNAHLAIYNLRGELVRELLNKKLPAGNYSVQWNGKDAAGSEVASGIYLYRLQVGNVSEMRKLSLLK